MDYSLIIIIILVAFIGGIIFTQLQDIDFSISDVWVYSKPVAPVYEAFEMPVSTNIITPIKTKEIIIPKSKNMLLTNPSVPEHLRFISDFIYPEQTSIITSAIQNIDNEEDYNELIKIYEQIKKEGIREDMNFTSRGAIQFYILNNKQYTFSQIIEISDNNIRNKGLSEGWIKNK